MTLKDVIKATSNESYGLYIRKKDGSFGECIDVDYNDPFAEFLKNRNRALELAKRTDLKLDTIRIIDGSIIISVKEV